MGSRSIDKPLTNAEARPLAVRYQQGETFESLRREAGVWANTLKRAWRRLGMSLRPEDDVCPICRVCGQRVAGSTRRHLCLVHVRCFCSTCEEPLPTGRANRWCSACDAEHKERYYAQPGRICTHCRTRPVTGQRQCCPRCDHDNYRLQRRALLVKEQRCRECRTLLPAGRRVPRCLTCHREHRDELRRQRGARDEHRCVICRATLRFNQQSYCDVCNGMLGKWRKLTHAGQGWGTIQRRRQWQAAGQQQQPEEERAA